MRSAPAPPSTPASAGPRSTGSTPSRRRGSPPASLASRSPSRCCSRPCLRNVDGELVTEDDVQEPRRLERGRAEGRRAALHAGPRDPAGLHRRPRRRRPRLDAGGGGAARAATRSGSTRSCPWTSWSTTRCRSTSSARPTRCGGTPTIEFERNRERYEFLRWGQKAFANFRVVPPATGIVHQVNLEYLAKVRPAASPRAASRSPCPTPSSGTDSHTTMINGLGVLGWGVGGIEAEAAMLGQPLYMVTPQVVGFRLAGQAPRGRDRDRPRPHRHPDAPQEGRRREVRRVLRPRPRRDEPGRPRHHREHGPRVRRHLRLLPGGRRDARLPAPDGPQPGRGRPRRALQQGAGPLPDRRDARPRLHRHAGARPRDGRAEPGRAEAAAGPRGPLRHEGVLPQGPHRAGQGARLRPRRRRTRASRWRSRCGGRRPSCATARS